jgi:hypothetical protein
VFSPGPRVTLLMGEIVLGIEGHPPVFAQEVAGWSISTSPDHPGQLYIGSKIRSRSLPGVPTFWAHARLSAGQKRKQAEREKADGNYDLPDVIAAFGRRITALGATDEGHGSISFFGDN